MVTQNSKFITQNHNLNPKNDLRQRTLHFSILVIQFIQSFPNQRILWSISDQLLRAATSIGANIIEAKSSSSRKDFIKFYEISLKSANETLYWLSLLKESGLITARGIDSIITEAKEISNMLGSSLITLKGKRIY